MGYRCNTIHSEYCVDLLKRLKDEMTKTMRKDSDGPCHKSIEMMAKLNQLGYESHPIHIILGIWRTAFLFRDIKRMLAVRTFSKNQEIISKRRPISRLKRSYTMQLELKYSMTAIIVVYQKNALYKIRLRTFQPNVICSISHFADLYT